MLTFNIVAEEQKQDPPPKKKEQKSEGKNIFNNIELLMRA